MKKEEIEQIRGCRITAATIEAFDFEDAEEGRRYDRLTIEMETEDGLPKLMRVESNDADGFQSWLQVGVHGGQAPGGETG